MDLSKEFQMTEGVKWDDAQCESFYNAIQEADGAKLWLGTNLGDQVANWLLRRSRKGQSTQKWNTQFEPFKSPIDGTVITCNRQLREHERKHGVRQVGSDI